MAADPSKVKRYTTNFTIPIYEYAKTLWHECIEAAFDVIDEALQSVKTLAETVVADATEQKVLAQQYAQDAADQVVLAADQVALAADQVDLATQQRVLAEAAAALAANLAGALTGTSSTSLTLTTGTKDLVTQAGEAYIVNGFVLLVSASDSTKWLFAQVLSYVDTNLQVSVGSSHHVGGSGSASDWNIAICGIEGPPGAGVTPQAIGFTISGGDAPETLTVDASTSISALVASIAAAGISAASSVTTTTTTTTTKTHYDFEPTDFGTYLKLVAGSSFTSTGTKYTAKNKSCFDVAIRDNSNVLLGFIPPGGTVTITLLSTTGDGTWSLDGASDFGATCSVANTSVLGSVVAAVELSTQYVFFLNASGSAVVVDRLNNSVGAAVAVTTRTTDMRIIKHSETEVLIVSGSAGNASIGARLISTSGTTITANAEASATTYATMSFYRFKQDGVASVTVNRYNADDALISVSELQANTYFTQYKIDNGAGEFYYSCNAIVVSGTTVTISASKNDGSRYAPTDGGAAVLSGSIIALQPSQTTGNTVAVRYSVSGTTLTENNINTIGGVQSVLGAKVVGDFLVWVPQGQPTARGVKNTAGSLTFSDVAINATVTDTIFANGALHYFTSNSGIFTVYDNAGTLSVASTLYPATANHVFALTEPDDNNKGYVSLFYSNVSGYQAVLQITYNANAAVTINAVQSQPHDDTTTNPQMAYAQLGKSRATSMPNYGFGPQRGALRGTRSAKDLRNYRHWVDRFFDFDKGKLRLMSDHVHHTHILPMTTTSGGAYTVTGIGVGPTHQCTVATGGTINGSARSLLLEIV